VKIQKGDFSKELERVSEALLEVSFPRVLGPR